MTCRDGSLAVWELKHVLAAWYCKEGILHPTAFPWQQASRPFVSSSPVARGPSAQLALPLHANAFLAWPPFYGLFVKVTNSGLSTVASMAALLRSIRYGHLAMAN